MLKKLFDFISKIIINKWIIDMIKCCSEKTKYIVKYDLGSLGSRTFHVCKKHINEQPWNRYILSQKIIES